MDKTLALEQLLEHFMASNEGDFSIMEAQEFFPAYHDEPKALQGALGLIMESFTNFLCHEEKVADGQADKFVQENQKTLEALFKKELMSSESLLAKDTVA